MSPLTQTAASKQLDTNERVLLRDQLTNKEVDLSVALAARKGNAFLPPDAFHPSIVNTSHVPANVCKPGPGAATKSSGAGSHPQVQTTERSSVPRTNGDAPVLLPPLRDKSGDKSGLEKQVAHAARAETAVGTALNLDESLAQRQIKTSLSGANGSIKPNNERPSTEKKHQIATSYAVPTASSSTTTFLPPNCKSSPGGKVQVGRATTMAWGPKPLHYRRRVRVALGMLAVVAVVVAAVVLVVILRSKFTPTDPPSAQPSSIPSSVPTVYPTAFPSAAPTGLYWTEVGTIGHLGGSDDVAISLSADGTHVAVGGGRPRIFGGGSVGDTRLGGTSEYSGGFVRVYRYDDDGFKWDPVGQALHGRFMEKDDAWFGSSVSLSLRGNRVAVGGEATSAPNDNEGGRGGTSPSEEASGVVSIFELEDDSWTSVGNISVGFNLTTASSSAATDVVLSSDGNSIACIVGGDPDLIEVHAWKRGKWTKVADFRGRAVALSWNGRRVAVGDPHANDGLGEVRVYDRVGGDNFVPNLTLSGKSDTKKFGFAVSLSRVGELLAVGAPNGFNRETGHESGLVRVFENRQKLWRLYGEDIFGGPEEESFGRSVSLSSDGTRLAVGTQMSGTTHGSRIRVYEIEFNAWTQLGNLIDGWTTGPVASLSADGDRIVVRSKRDTGLEQNATHVQVLDLLGSPTSPPVSCASDAACSCGPGQLLFDLTLVTDEDGDETQWLLTDPTRRFGRIASGGPYASGSKTYVTKKCVSRGCFQFTIYDSGSDGMCCVYGEGGYTVSLGGEMVAFGGRFGGEETTVFGSCPTPSPAPFPDVAFTPTDLETETNATEQHGSATPSPGIVASHSATNPIPIPVAGLSFILMMQLVLQEHF